MEQTLVKFKSKYKTFHSRKASDDIVCEMPDILSRGMSSLKNPVHVYLNYWQPTAVNTYQWRLPAMVTRALIQYKGVILPV